MPFIPNTDDDRRKMLNAIGVKKFEELISDIPKELLFDGVLNLPAALSEMELMSELNRRSKQNIGCDENIVFVGGGAYDHYIPAAVDHIVSRSEFYTAYTPYQPEVSQGTLQVIYEFQSMIAELSRMDVANASIYDGGSALAEAVLMAVSETRRKKILISKTVNPFYRDVVATYLRGQNVDIIPIDEKDGVTDIDRLEAALDNQTAGVVVQHPNFFGCLEQVHELEELIHRHGALYLSSNDPLSLAILEPPGDYGVDIFTGEGQCFGNALNLGGPFLGLMATRDKFIRRMPGRIAGITEDLNGNRGFVLTFQTREQHIRRDKATSNICTNQALNALAGTVYLALMGRKGLEKIALTCLEKSHYLAEKISELNGFELKFKKPFFKEFAIKTPVDPDLIIHKLLSHRINAGINVRKYDYQLDHVLLVAVTEKRSREQMDLFVHYLKEATQV
ncbi:aminomethyl-transferring glycine dehydrogenase subunit GcvPA [candidate division KSB1 bacterium]|nr:aminomethyl-transferring glycine dehydrogenase subunit GcvPA [candidate division KSB1 bacterium]